MFGINMFVEDNGHERVLTALVKRMASQYGVAVEIMPQTSTGGHGRVLSKLKEYIRDLKNGAGEATDLLIVAIDGNCAGYLECKQEIDKVMKGFAGQVIYAIPDPHIERWLLLDSAAFKKVLGKGCSAPAQKCDRDRYKRLLLEAVRQTGTDSLSGGLEYTEELVNEMDLERMERMEDSLGRFLKSLRQQLQIWQRATQQ
jgi:hypothetical protein